MSRNQSELISGLSAEFAALGRMVTAGGSIVLEAGRVSPLAAMNPLFFKSGGSVPYALPNLLVDSDSFRAMRPGSVGISSTAETAIQAGGEMTLGSNEGITVSARETVSITASDDIKTSTSQSHTQYAHGNMILASDGAMILRCGEAEIVLQPNGDITFNGRRIKANGDQICLN